MANWLVKTEADVYSIEQFRRDGRTRWDCVRNYQARNYLKAMDKGDAVLIYHSNSDPRGIVGLAIVSAPAAPDETQFDKAGEYYDPKASRDAPRWFSPELKFDREFSTPIALEELKAQPELKKMVLLQRGSRLSVQPVDSKEFKAILQLRRA